MDIQESTCTCRILCFSWHMSVYSTFLINNFLPEKQNQLIKMQSLEKLQ